MLNRLVARSGTCEICGCLRFSPRPLRALTL